MKKSVVLIVLLLFAGVLGARQGLCSDKGRTPSDRPPFQRIDPGKLESTVLLALMTFEMAKLGALQSFPYAKVTPYSKIDLRNKTDYRKFRQRNVGIVEYIRGADGTHTLGMVAESRDKFGRIDLSHNRIVFNTKEPDEKEADAIREFILKTSKDLEGLNQELRGYVQKSIVEYRQVHGLKPESRMDENNAEVLSRAMPILIIRELVSYVLYPQEPRHSFYILPIARVNRNPDKFSGDIENIEEVKKYAIPVDVLKQLAKRKQQYVLFIYFFDRVDPSLPLQVCFSSSPQEQSKSMSPKQYAVPGRWPVLIESFRIDKLSSSSELYITLLIDEKPMASYKLR